MARDLIPPPSPAGRPQPAGHPAARRAAARAAAGRSRPGAADGAAAADPLPQPLRVPDRRARGRGRRLRARAGRRDLDDGRRSRGGRRPAPELVQVASGRTRRSRAARREIAEEGRRRVPASRRQAARGCQAAGRSRSMSCCARPPAISRRSTATRSSTSSTASGRAGSIKGGKASEERHKVLQREALELALYTFRYLPDADGVVTVLPPPPPAAAATASPTATPGERGRGAADAGSVDHAQGDLLPPGRPQAAAAGAARHDGAGAGADAGHAATRRRRSRSTR